MKKIFYSSFVLAILLISCVYAFGVTTWYWPGNPLKMEPGETKEIYLELQNMVGDDDVTAKVELIQGSEIAQMIDSSSTYTVPAHTKDTNVNVRVSIPQTDPIGKTYALGFSVKTLASGAGGGVALSTGFNKGFDVEVAEKPKPAPTPETEAAEGGFPWITLLIVLIVIVALIIAVKAAKKKQ